MALLLILAPVRLLVNAAAGGRRRRTGQFSAARERVPVSERSVQYEVFVDAVGARTVDRVATPPLGGRTGHHLAARVLLGDAGRGRYAATGRCDADQIGRHRRRRSRQVLMATGRRLPHASASFGQHPPAKRRLVDGCGLDAVLVVVAQGAPRFVVERVGVAAGGRRRRRPVVAVRIAPIEPALADGRRHAGLVAARRMRCRVPQAPAIAAGNGDGSGGRDDDSVATFAGVVV